MDKALALLLTTMIGAGVLALPKVLAASWPYSLLSVLFILPILYLTGYAVVELHLRMKKPAQLPSIVAHFVDERLKLIAYLFLVLSIYGALTAYFFGISSATGINPYILAALMFLAGTGVVLSGTEFLGGLSSRVALLTTSLLLFSAALNFYTVAVKGPTIPRGNLSAIFEFSATLLFALFGLNVLPEVNYLSGGKGKEIYAKALLICSALYLLYAISTVLLLGNSIEGLSTLSLAGYYRTIGPLFRLLTALVMFFPYLGLGLSLRHIYEFDLSVPRALAAFLVYLPPTFLFLLTRRYGAGFLAYLLAVGQFTLPVFIIMLLTAYIAMKNSSGEMEEPWVYILLITYAALAGKFLLNFLKI